MRNRRCGARERRAELNGDIQLLQASAKALPLPDESVQCIVTSPPYWGLRRYAGEQEMIWEHGPVGIVRCDFRHDHEWGKEVISAANDSNRGSMEWTTGGNPATKILGSKVSQGSLCSLCGAWRGAYGLEPTIEMYMAHTLEILREMWRVLRKDGVLFWNIGDSYARDAGKGQHKPGDGGKQNYIIERGGGKAANEVHLASGSGSLKPKDLCLIPERVALAAQADGWWVRSRILWCKPNPMPESVTDRPTDAAEHIWMFTKSAQYFWDADAVREPAVTGWNGSSFTDDRDRKVYENLGAGRRNNPEGYKPGHDVRDGKGRRNIRNVWTFPTQPYAGSHFATFPEELPRRCILAATSTKGACAQCGAPWKPVVGDAVTSGRSWNTDAMKSQLVNRNENSDFAGAQFYANYQPPKTIGWSPTCRCRGQHGRTMPCVVLDPFGGSGTTGRIALSLRRRAILADIAYGDEYLKLAKKRISGVQLEAFL